MKVRVRPPRLPDHVSPYLFLIPSLSRGSAGLVLCDHNERIHVVWGGNLRVCVWRWCGTAAQQIWQGLRRLCWGCMSATGGWGLSRRPGCHLTGKHGGSSQRLASSTPSESNLSWNWGRERGENPDRWPEEDRKPHQPEHYAAPGLFHLPPLSSLLY